MNNELISTENEDVETPETGEELMTNFLRDIVVNEDPEVLASDFIDGFVLQDKPETAQILGMLEMPIPSLMELVKAALEQSYQAQINAVNNHGVQYLEGLKKAVKTQMTELAGG